MGYLGMELTASVEELAAELLSEKGLDGAIDTVERWSDLNFPGNPKATWLEVGSVLKAGTQLSD